MDLRSQLQSTLGDTYTIERELGGGGMSRVFVAVEQSLGRQVVVKVLPTDMAGHVSIERFKREIRLAASLQQANIVPVLSAGDAGGVAYYTMPFVKGESLRARLATKGALPIAECVAILRDIARALAFAHSEGVVHRDIKPENILLSGGTAVVTDFGIAKAVVASSTQPGAPTLTQIGLAIGTPAYMAPEQAVGDVVDHRADLYALGVVAYEMLTGTAPFAGRSAQAQLAAHAMEAAEPVAKRRADAPPRLAALVARCMSKEQGDRPASASEVLEALESATTPQDGVVDASRRTEKPSIAVMPFANLSPDPADEYFADGLTDEIITDLSPIHALHVIARGSMMQFKGSNKDPQVVARELKVRYVLDGSVRRAGSSLRLTARLIDAHDGSTLWSDKLGGTVDDVFAMQEQVSRTIVEALKLTLNPREEQHLRARPIGDVRAFECYLQARQAMWVFTVESLDRAERLLLDAQALVGKNTLLLAALGGVHINYIETGHGNVEARLASARQCVDELTALDPDSFALYFLRGWFQWRTGEIREAITSLTRARELDPGNSDVGVLIVYTHLLAGQDARARELADTYAAIDPLTPLFQCMPGFCEIMAGRPEAGVPYYRRFRDMAENDPVAHLFFMWSLFCADERAEALAAADELARRFAATPFGSMGLACAHALRGESEAGKAVLTPAVRAMSRHSESMANMLSGIHTLLGDVDAAIDAIEDRLRLGFAHYPFLARGSRVYASLRSHPRFNALLEVARQRWERGGTAAADLAADRAQRLPKAPATTGAVPPKPSIAVLPLTNMSASADDEYFSDGITEDIIAQLSRIASLRVIARTSVMRYKKTGKSAREIAAELGVSNVVEGSVRRAGNKLRIVAQLIDAATEAPLWNETFDRDLADVFAIQSEVSLQIANALRSTLTGPATTPTTRHAPPANVDAYDACLRGRFEAYKGTPESYQKSIDHFDRAIALDPRLTQAHLGLAETLAFQAVFVGQPEVRFPRARVHATKALELDDTLPEGHAMLAYIAFWFDWNWAEAEHRFARAIELGPNSAIAHNYYAVFLANLGRLDDAIALARRAVELDPLWSTAHQALGFALYSGGQFAESTTASDRALDLAPDYAAALVVKGFALLELHQYDAALTAFRRTIATAPGVSVAIGGVVQALVRAGRITDAKTALADLGSPTVPGSIQPSALAWAHVALGNVDEAFACVERGIIEHESFIACLPTFAWWDPMRRDQRFGEILTRLRFPDWSHTLSDARRLAYAERAQPSEPAVAKPSIAVLPLANLSASADDEYFADGMTEDIIAQLSKVASLKVISRTSVMRYKKTEADMRTIASALGASHIVEGTVRRAGNRLRIVAQLIDASTDAHLWADTFDRELTDVFAIQSEVAERIATALRATLTPGERSRLTRAQTADPQAYDLCLRGRHHWNRRTDESIRRAINYFEQAISRDPGYAAAHAALAEAYVFAALGYAAIPRVEALTKAAAAASRALAIDPAIPEALCATGLTSLIRDWDVQRARRMFEQTITLNPGYAAAYQWLAWCLFTAGDYVGAARSQERALELDPLNVSLIAETGWPYSYAELHELARRRYERALELDPEFGLGHYNLGTTYLGERRYAEAIGAFEKALSLLGRAPFAIWHLAVAHVESRRHDIAESLLTELKALTNAGMAGDLFVALVSDALGRTADALDAVERAIANREPMGWGLGLEKYLAFPHARANPRFETLMRSAGIAPHDVAGQRALLLAHADGARNISQARTR
jgi:TolB-like protein/Tfp pilus assembly protein PilF